MSEEREKPGVSRYIGGSGAPRHEHSRNKSSFHLYTRKRYCKTNTGKTDEIRPAKRVIEDNRTVLTSQSWLSEVDMRDIRCLISAV